MNHEKGWHSSAGKPDTPTKRITLDQQTQTCEVLDKAQIQATT